MTEYLRWLNKNESNRGLFFPRSKEVSLIEKKMRKILKAAVIDKSDPPPKKDPIGRIIIHGYIPDLLWSTSEAYRPVDFFFGQIHDICIGCLKKTPIFRHKKLEKADISNDPTLYISPFWLNLLGKVAEGSPVDKKNVMPKCWEVPNFMPNYGLDCSGDQEGKKPFASFGKFTLLEVLQLSRMRFRKWVLKKSEIIRTPASSIDTDRRTMKLLGYKYYHKNLTIKEKKRELPNITVVAHEALELRYPSNPKENNKNYLKKNKNYLEDYIRTFAFDMWSQASVINNAVTLSLKGKTLPTEEAWTITGDNWWSPKPKPSDYFNLDTQSCALTYQPFNGNTEEILQGVYNLQHPNGLLMIYFEFKNQEMSKFVNSDPNGEKQHTLINAKLHKFCSQHIVECQNIFRDTDSRWENHEAFVRLYPQEMSKELLGNLKDIEKQLSDNAELLKESGYADFLLTLKRIVLFYKRRVLKEEDTPVNLALASMGEVWRWPFNGALAPHYPDFQRFQQLLSGLTKYRDHLTHSIQVFLLGEKLMEEMRDIRRKYKFNLFEKVSNAKIRVEERIKRMIGEEPAKEIIEAIKKHKFPPENSKQNKYMRFEERLNNYQWALASLMHDFACPAEKANDILIHLFDTFLGIRDENGNSGKAGLRNALAQKQPSYQAFLYALLRNTRTGASINSVDTNEYDLPAISEFTYQKLTEDHGFLSAIYLFNQTFEKKNPTRQEWWFLKTAMRDNLISALFGSWPKHLSKDEESPLSKLAEAAVLEVLDAIVKHNAFKNEYDVISSGTPPHRFPFEFFSAEGSIFGGPIPGLLLLCDTLCDWGRVVLPDELHRHERGRIAYKKNEPIMITRPEGYVEAIKTLGKEDDPLTIVVNYKWRLPYQNDFADNENCLAQIYTNLKGKLKPYSPNFRVWDGCTNCPNGKKILGAIKKQQPAKPRQNKECRAECRARRILVRFWSEIVAPGDKNRLKFPEKFRKDNTMITVPNPFNRIQIKINFYGVEIYPVNLMKTSDLSGETHIVPLTTDFDSSVNSSSLK